MANSRLERDIRDGARLSEGSDLLKLMELFAESTGTLLNVPELSTALKKTRITIENHLAILEKLFLVQQLHAQADWFQPHLRFWHYRDKDQKEVDCVITRGRKVWGIEVELSQSGSSSDAEGLHKLAEYVKGNFQMGMLLYYGDDTFSLGDSRIPAVPISKL